MNFHWSVTSFAITKKKKVRKKRLCSVSVVGALEPTMNEIVSLTNPILSSFESSWPRVMLTICVI